MERSGRYLNARDFVEANADRFERLPQRGAEVGALIERFKGGGDLSGAVALHDAWAHGLALRAGLRVDEFCVCPSAADWGKVAELSERFMELAPRRWILSEKIYARIADHTDRDGIVSLARIPVYEPDGLPLGGESTVFVLDGLTKPGNVGVILRSCDGAGVDAVMTCRLRTRVTHPNAVKSSMGAAFFLPIAPFSDAGECKAWLTRNGFTIYVADPKADNRFDATEYRGRIAVVFGNEHVGASAEWYTGGARAITIPMRGRCESLNVSVAASILAFAIEGDRARRGARRGT